MTKPADPKKVEKDFSIEFETLKEVIKALEPHDRSDRERLLKSVIKFYQLEDLLRSECDRY